MAHRRQARHRRRCSAKPQCADRRPRAPGVVRPTINHPNTQWPRPRQLGNKNFAALFSGSANGPVPIRSAAAPATTAQSSPCAVHERSRSAAVLPPARAAASARAGAIRWSTVLTRGIHAVPQPSGEPRGSGQGDAGAQDRGRLPAREASGVPQSGKIMAELEEFHGLTA